MKSLYLWMLVFGSTAFSFQYFERPIDYWSKDPPKAPEQVKKPNNTVPKFDWKKAVDPKHPDFFREGNYEPPEAYKELVRNPSEENIRGWIEFQETKNRLLKRVQIALEKYRIDNTVAQKVKAEAKTQVPSDQTGRYRFRLYFESTCPPCQRMLKTMSNLHRSGYYVELHQVDAGRNQVIQTELPVVMADEKDLANKKIQSWPTLLIADTLSKKVYRMHGFKSTEQVWSKLPN